MPIHFVCEHCQVRLKVATRKAGTQAKCPKCKGAITVPRLPESAPEPSAETDAPGPPQSVERTVEPPEPDPYSQFVVYDVDSELVYETEDETEDTAGASGAFDPNRIAVSRRVIYLQGVLLAAVCICSFSIGLLVGAGVSETPAVDSGLPQPCSILGSIRYAQDSGAVEPDPGAVALIVPRDIHPEEKVDIVGLRPQDPPPAEDDERLRAIQGIGGDYCRADAEGRFQLRVPDRSGYFVLFISAARSQGDKEPSREQLAQIGRFFLLAPQLFDGHAFVWREELIRGDREIDIEFP